MFLKGKGGSRKHPMRPGYAVLPEDRFRPSGLAMLPKKRRRHKRERERAPIAIDHGTCSVREVEERVLRAMQTLRAVPDPDRKFLTVKCGMPPHVQDYIDAYNAVQEKPRFRPTPADISDYLRALAWVRHLPRIQWMIMWQRSFGLSFGLIGEKMGQSDETARRRFREAITDAWIVANGLIRPSSTQR